MSNFTLNNTLKYRAIVTSKFRTKNLMNFYDMIGDGQDENTIFTSFGRSTPWSSNEKDPGFAPPYPADNEQGVSDVWSNMIGILKVSKDLIDPVIPRRDWGDVRYPNARVFNIGDIVVCNSAPYNQTDPGKGWTVYRVVDVPSEGTCSIDSMGLNDKNSCMQLGGSWIPSHESSAPPRGIGDGNEMGYVEMRDGYVWEYLYTIPPDVSINQCTNEYIVVPTPDELSQDPVRWGYKDTISWAKNDTNLVYRLAVNTLRFRAYMDSLYFPEAAWPGNDGFRQLSVILNPLIAKNKPNEPDVKATALYYYPSGLDLNSGEMLYIDNRQPLIRSMDQTEEINILFSF